MSMTTIMDMLNIFGDTPTRKREYYDKENPFSPHMYFYPWSYKRAPDNDRKSNNDRNTVRVVLEREHKEDGDKHMIIALVGESGSGKSTIAKHLVEKHGFETIVSYTTRPPRDNEIDGVDYHFVDEAKFKEMKEQGLFAETAMYRGWNYGSLTRDYASEKGDKITILTPHGLRQVKENKDINLVSFHINVPRRDRLIKILQRGDDIEECYRRSLSDVGQFDGIGDEVSYVIDNPGYAKSVDEITYEIYKCLYEELMKKSGWSIKKCVDASDERIAEQG